MNYEEALSNTLETGTEDDGGLTRSEELYLRFRSTVEPGLFEVGFDLTPAKSAPFGYTDQTHRSHILNGAAFAARLNYGLHRLDPGAALDDDELRRAFALFAVHDLHKTHGAQQRRANSSDRRDADKDITPGEVEKYVEALNLREFAPGLEGADYMAAALGTESRSGRHRGATSRTFVRLRPWLRMMDAAASSDNPVEAADLQNRLSQISGEVTFQYHSLDDTRGITTNFLTSTIAEFLDEQAEIVPVVYFIDGALYLTSVGFDPAEHLEDREEMGEELTTRFMDTVREKVNEASTLEETRQTLVDKLNYGFMEFSRPTYLLYGFDRADEALQADLVDRMSGDPNLYSQYRLGTIAAYASGTVQELPSDWRTGQAATVYVATLFSELFDPLEGGDTLAGAQTIANALGVSEAGEFLANLDDWEWSGTVSDEKVETLAEHLGESPSEISEAVEDGIHVRRVKRFAAILALAYIEDGANGSLTGTSAEGVLQNMSERLKDHFRSWNDRWDENRGRGWDPEQLPETKAEAFLEQKIDTVRNAIRQYIADSVVVFGQTLGEGPTDKSKLGQYTSRYQPHICLLCNSVLTGSGSKSDFETSEDTIGLSMRFSHLSEITAEGGEPDALACPMCELEMVIRKSVHDFGEEDADFLFLAPDYFYAPADVELQRTVYEDLFASAGYNLLQVAQQLVDTRPDNRWEAADEILSILGPDDDAESFQNTLKNYDAAFTDIGSLGVFRLDPPRRDVNSRDPVTRVPRTILNLAVAMAVSWLTSTRVLLTSRPVPMTRFDEHDEMLRAVDLPAEVRERLGDTASLAYLHDLDRADAPATLEMLVSRNPSSDGKGESMAVNRSGDDATDGTSNTDLADPSETEAGAKRSRVEQHTIEPLTQFSEQLYRLAGLLTVTFRAHGTEVQRLKSTISAMQSPFPGATTLLKGDEVTTDYGALNAALVLDTLTNKDMSNSIDQLAEAGFDAVRPELDSDSNYNFERLFRVAREAVSDNMMESANREELKTIVAGEVMKAAARAETSDKFAEEEVKRGAAEQFAEVFVDDILYGICNGDFYQLRRHENSLAAGYNAAIRRKQAESFTNSDSDTNGSTNSKD